MISEGFVISEKLKPYFKRQYFFQSGERTAEEDGKITALEEITEMTLLTLMVTVTMTMITLH